MGARYGLFLKITSFSKKNDIFLPDLVFFTKRELSFITIVILANKFRINPG